MQSYSDIGENSLMGPFGQGLFLPKWAVILLQVVVG